MSGETFFVFVILVALMAISRRRPILEAPICHWCAEPIGESPYRTPIADIPGGRWMVCGPLCPKRPEGVLVFTDGRAL